MSARRYPAYKPSGVEWLGEVPAHWEVVRLKVIAECLDGKRVPLNATERAERPGDVPYWGANCIQGYVDEAIFDEELVLLGEDGAPFFDRLRPVAFRSMGPVWPNNHVHVLRVDAAMRAAFVVNVLNCTDYATFVDGSTRDKLTQAAMWNIPVPKPPRPEQEAIASFLDAETAKIDALVAEQDRLVGLLREKRQAVISHAVTRGLDPAAPMKPSGVEWLGEVPAHWEVSRVKWVARFVTGWTPPSGVDAYYGDDHRWANISDLGPRTVTETAKGLTDEGARSGGLEKVPVGSLMYSFKLSIGQVSFAGHPMYTNEAIATFLPGPSISLEWAYYALPEFLVYAAELNIYGAKLLNQDRIRGAILPVPPVTEQAAIAAFLDAETARIDALIAEADKGSALLKERRAALIAAAVTGQLDLRGGA